MPPEPAPAPRGRGWLHVLIALVIAFDVAAFFQWADGAFQSEFGGHPDEAQNYLAGLDVRGSLLRPQEHANVGNEISLSPAAGQTRGFQLVLGGWMAVFGTSRMAVLLFMAALAALTATLIFDTVRCKFGAWAGAVASLVWLCAPAVRESYEMILPVQLGALVLTAAALLWASLMDARAAHRTAVPKWIGGGCVPAIVIAVVLSIFAMPFLKECAFSLGLGAAAFALAGAVIFRRSDARPGASQFALVALVAGVIFACWMRGAGLDVRVLIMAAPALAILAVHGAVSLAGIVGSQAAITAEYSRRRALWLFLLLLLALPSDLLSTWQKDWRGFGPAAAALVEESRGPLRVLVISDALGEGMFLAELAMHDRGRQITVERGSRVLVESRRSDGVDPGQHFLEDEHLFAHLISGHVQYIVLDSTARMEGRAGYRDQIRRVIEDNVNSFWPIFRSPVVRDGELMGSPLRIFRVTPSPGAELR